MAALEESGAAYEAVRIDIVAGETFSLDYKKIHPYGRVPALKRRMVAQCSNPSV
jgi:glutathione S-transferase